MIENFKKGKIMDYPILMGELEKRALPNVFTAQNGESVRTKDVWEKAQRPYWLNILLKEEYGKIPPRVQPAITTQTNVVDFAGKAVWETVTFTFTYKGKTHSFPTNMIYPAGAKSVPFFIYLNFRPDVPDRYLPVEELIDNGFGIFSVCYNDVTKDDGDFTDGLAGIFQEGERAGNDTGKICYWAYAASNMMDYLCTRPEADAGAIGVCGHSRLGKTALLTAAIDERFAFVCSNNSGCSGAGISRYADEKAEKVADICKKFPYWFAPNYLQYANNEQALPFDQHCLIAMIAPRAVYVGGAIEDIWAGNDNQFLSCVAATPVWKLYGIDGMITPDKLPECGDTLTDGNVGFHLRKGKHFHSRTDWLIYMDAVKKYLQRQ